MHRKITPSSALFVIAAVASTSVFGPALMSRLDPEAYPREPDKRRALELCGQLDPTFLRFVPSERADCYARSPILAAAAKSAEVNGAGN